MVKVAGPMFSLDAKGTLADAITFSMWKGRPYVRERVIPSNPKSEAQVGRRSMFTFLSQAWAGLGAGAQGQWEDLADQLVASNFNAYLSDNMKYWHNFICPSQGTPWAGILTPSDNVLTAAAWEENRIKLSLAGTALGQAWGICIFGSLAALPTPTVGKCIIVAPDTTIAAHDLFWTPPQVSTYYFNSIAFATDGAQAAAGGQMTAVP